MLRSTKQELHDELKIKYREFFESQLAIHLLKHPEYFPAVEKISTHIINLMETHKNMVIDVIRDNPKIIMELREPYFGSCFDSEQTVSADRVYEKIISILNDKSSDLSSIMQVHCIFVYRIYDHIKQTKEKADFFSTLFPATLFSQDNRCRIEKTGSVKATSKLGISKHPVFTKMLEKHHKKHVRALDKYDPDNDSVFSKTATEKSIPTVCGPSSHTASLMVGAKLYGELTASELKEYAMASFAFLTAGGNHSFHEVFMIANLLGVTYQADNYQASIPESIASAEDYKNIQTRFPEFLG